MGITFILSNIGHWCATMVILLISSQKHKDAKNRPRLYEMNSYVANIFNVDQK